VTVHVVLAGGGSAGHVEPMLNTADALARRGISSSCLGTAEGLESRLVPLRGYELAVVPKVPLPRKPTPDLLRVPGRLRAAVKAARAHLDAVDASVVVGFGGYVSVPAYLAARKRGTPVVIHEANARAGIANKLGARWAVAVAAAVEGSGLKGAQVIGLPLRPAIAHLDRTARRAEARASFGLAEGPVLMVTGGSQGARRINQAVVDAAPVLAEAGVQVLQITGPKNLDDVQAALGSGPPTHHLVGYVDGMDSAYAASDLVLCRSGAMTCAELNAVGLPAVYVPLPIGNGEQALNARPTVEAGGGLMVDDADLDAAWIESHVVPLLLDSGRLVGMSQAARRLGHPGADEALVDLIVGAAG
jgi:UDP-N-acetylglucosamine--N-acetylmuramyl-(pentapeptide) pyrophosphoryl-undecaprenol N-acetylglucosamine transferase